MGGHGNAIKHTRVDDYTFTDVRLLLTSTFVKYILQLIRPWVNIAQILLQSGMDCLIFCGVVHGIEHFAIRVPPTTDDLMMDDDDAADDVWDYCSDDLVLR